MFIRINTVRLALRSRRSEDDQTIAEQELFVSVDMTTAFEQLVYEGVANHLGEEFDEFSDIAPENLAQIEDLTTKIYKVRPFLTELSQKIISGAFQSVFQLHRK